LPDEQTFLSVGVNSSSSLAARRVVPMIAFGADSRWLAV